MLDRNILKWDLIVFAESNHSEYPDFPAFRRKDS